MKKNSISIAILLVVVYFGFFNAHAFENDDSKKINGVVFEDSNNNLQLDEGEKGIQGILVSNQHEIVLTNKEGQYTLPVPGDETIIYVIKPAGFTVPLNENNLPQFYYIHKPEGSPDIEYGGIQPTGELPERLNFPMQKTTQIDSFSVVVMADPQSRTIEQLNYLRDDVTAELIGTEALFGIILGDIVHDDLSLFNPYNATMSMIDIPMYNVPGNHDFDIYPDTNLYTLETFKQHFGPDYYAFEYGKVSFIVINSVIWIEDHEDKSKGDFQGTIDSKQLEWLENYLQYVPEEQLIVFCTHVPLNSMNRLQPHDYILNRKELYDLVKERKHLLAMSGHLHALENHYLDRTMGWNAVNAFQHISCVAACGGWWKGPKDERGIPVATQLKDGTPNGYHIFSFSENTYQQRFKAAGKEENFQVRISSPSGVIMKQELDSVIIAANFFNGNELSELTCQIDNSMTVVLEKTKMKDPFAERLNMENLADYNNKLSSRDSNHIWAAKLPADLSIGIHKIIVIANDEYGNEYRQSAIFEVK